MGDAAVPVVRPMTLGDAPVAADVLAEAFDGYVWTSHTVAADDHRDRLRTSFEAYLRLLVIPAGTAWISADRRAAALWTSPDAEPIVSAGADELEAIVRTAAGDRWDAGRAAAAALSPHRPDVGTWVLESVGTRPAARRSGLASALIAAGLTRCDADQAPAALETCGEVNVAFYRRLGFEVTASTSLPGGPTVHSMLRPAQAP